MLLSSTVLFTACSDNKANEEADETPDKKERSEAIESIDEPETDVDFCDCLQLTLDKLKLIDSDPEKLKEYQKELEPCSEYFADIELEEQIKLIHFRRFIQSAGISKRKFLRRVREIRKLEVCETYDENGIPGNVCILKSNAGSRKR